MNIVSRRIPTLSGMEKINKFIKGEQIRISSFKEGIECLIYEGKVTDINGVPFRNKEFQEKFKYFSETLYKYKYIAKGRIVNIREENVFDFSKLKGIFFGAIEMSPLELANIKIELESIEFESQIEVSPKGIFSILKGITDSINKKENIYNVFIQKAETFESRETDEEKSFIEEESKKGNRMLFIGLETKRTVYLNPYIEVSGEIQDVMNDYIKVIRNNVVYRIPNTNNKQYKVIQHLFYTKKLDKLKFKAIQIEGRLESPQMI